MSAGLTSSQTQAVTAALAHLDCAAIYLFGSRAAGTHRPDSDVDIAFLPTSIVSPLDCFDLANRLSDQLGNHVDLVDLSTASTVLAKEVVTKGIVLFTGDLIARQSFEMYTLSDYARLNEERGKILAP
jgi:predicted nucleotidyltransferase